MDLKESEKNVRKSLVKKDYFTSMFITPDLINDNFTREKIKKELRELPDRL